MIRTNIAARRARRVMQFALAVLVTVLMRYDAAWAGAHEHEVDASEQKAAPKKRGRGGERPYGREGDPRKVTRVIHIDMSDTMRFFPDQVRVSKGATVRFVVRNKGKLPHELVIGTMDELKEHAKQMRQSADSEQEHGTNGIRLAAGASGRLVWQFTRAGEFYYGCLMPGHFDAGMIGTVVVR